MCDGKEKKARPSHVATPIGGSGTAAMPDDQEHGKLPHLVGYDRFTYHMSRGVLDTVKANSEAGATHWTIGSFKDEWLAGSEY